MAITTLSGIARANPASSNDLVTGGAVAERQITDQPCGHILTNVNVWSPDGRWIVYDTRSDPAGEKFDCDRIEIVNVETRETRTIYRARNGAHCGVATFSPATNKVVFIVGPEHPADDWQYSAWHRTGLLVDIEPPFRDTPLEASDFTPPFTPGALRGGTHVHVFDGEGSWVSFTYEDHTLATLDSGQPAERDLNQRNVGIGAPTPAVRVPRTHPRNRDGSTFSVLVTRTTNRPRPNSDDISRAYEDAWVGTHGYLRNDGSRQRHAIAFQGDVATAGGKKVAEVFVVDLPADVTAAGDGPLEGSATTRPYPPRGTQQRRLTRTEDRRYPGIQGPRHWLRSSPDGNRIAFLMRDDAGIVQIWTISPNGGEQQQLTQLAFNVASAFTWSADGQALAFVADNSVFVVDASSGTASRLTPRSADETTPRPEACVFSPDGSRVAYVRPVPHAGAIYNQIFVAETR